MQETYAQRMRVRFATDASVKYVGNLDMHRAWERAIRRARLPLAYSQGFNPQPRLQLAAAMPVGFTGDGEVADVYLNEELEPAEFVARLNAAMPPGIRLLAAEPVARELPSLQSKVAGAVYRVEVEVSEEPDAFRARLDRFDTLEHAWRERRRGKDVNRYDLRPLVTELRYAGVSEEGHVFTVAMRAEPGATGRPDELLAELGLADTPRAITRTELVFAADA